MSVQRRTARAARERRRALRPLSAALAELLRAHRPPAIDGQDVWVCLTPTTAHAIARIAARRVGASAADPGHPAHAAAHKPVQVRAATAAAWRQDAWQAAAEGLIDAADARALAAQIDPPSPT